MSLHRRKNSGGEVVWVVKWRDEAGGQRSKVLGRKTDAEAFDAEIKRRKRTAELGLMDAGKQSLDDYVSATWAPVHAAHLSVRTQQNYASSYDRHISPRLGSLPLRAIDAEVIARFQGELVRKGVGAHAIRKAITLLGAILERAAEARRIPFNPQRVVRKSRLPFTEEVRPIAPIRVERMRAGASAREAALLSVLAYAGLRPGELRRLRWRHLGERTLLVNAEKTGRRRNVRLLTQLKADLEEWSGDQDRSVSDHVFPGESGEQWTANGFEKWRQRRFTSLLGIAELDKGRPYDLRHSFASLLLHEGRDVIYVARQLGHGAELTLRTYGHVIEELVDAPQLPAEEAIRRARQEVAGESKPRLGAAEQPRL